MSDLAKLFGLFLVAEGAGSLVVFREQPPVFQLGRLVRVGIGVWLVAKG